MRRVALSLVVLVVLAGCARVGTASDSPGPSDPGFAELPTPSLEATPSDSPTPSASEDLPTPDVTATPDPTEAPTAAPTPRVTPKPTPKPTLNPNWPVTAKVSNAVLTPSAGTDVDTMTWQVTSAADGAVCEIYLRFYKGELFMGNLSDQEFYHAGQTNKWTVQIPPDQHDETANYTLACFIGSNTYENKHWATPGTITVE